MKNKKKILGRLILIQERARYYMSIVQFAMVTFLTLETMWNRSFLGFNYTTLIILCGVFGIGFLVFDWYFIFPATMNEQIKMNPFFMELNRKIDNIEKRLGE